MSFVAATSEFSDRPQPLDPATDQLSSSILTTGSAPGAGCCYLWRTGKEVAKSSERHSSGRRGSGWESLK